MRVRVRARVRVRVRVSGPARLAFAGIPHVSASERVLNTRVAMRNHARPLRPGRALRLAVQFRCFATGRASVWVNSTLTDEANRSFGLDVVLRKQCGAASYASEHEWRRCGKMRVRRARLSWLEPERVHELLELILADRAALVEVHEVEDLTEPDRCKAGGLRAAHSSSEF